MCETSYACPSVPLVSKVLRLPSVPLVSKSRLPRAIGVKVSKLTSVPEPPGGSKLLSVSTNGVLEKTH